MDFVLSGILAWATIISALIAIVALLIAHETEKENKCLRKENNRQKEKILKLQMTGYEEANKDILGGNNNG